MKNKKRNVNPLQLLAAALMLCMGALLFPVTAFAQSEKDTTPPSLSAELSGETLTVSASDEGSGIEAVYIDGRRVSTLVNGAATVNVKEYHGGGKDISVYAKDYAGNKSETAKFTNPFYQAPAPLPQPTVPAPSSSSTSQPAPTSSSTPASGGNSASSSGGGTQQPGTSQPEAASSSSSTSETALPDTSGGNAFTPEGTGTVQDNATEDDGKEFFTITTADGNVFYLVIDRQRGVENVYFLGAVTESDLLALAEADIVPGESAIPEPTPLPDTSEPEPGADNPGDGEDGQEPEKESGGAGSMVFLLLAVLAVGGAGWYFKIYKPKQQAGFDDEEYDELEDTGEWEDDDEPPFDMDDDGPQIEVVSDYGEDDEQAGRAEYEQEDGTEEDTAADEE